MGLDHISFTQLNMILLCGESYRRRYVQGEKIQPSGSMVRGRCGHKVEEINYKGKIKTGIDLPVEAIRDLFSDEWGKQKYEIVWNEDELDGESPTKTEAKFKDTGILVIETYHKELAPLAIPVAIEERFTVEFQGGYPSLTGIIDRIDEGDHIVDLKFVGKSPTADDAAKDVQLTAYQFGFLHAYKKKPALLKKEYAVSTKVPKTVTQEVEARDDETIERFLRRLETAMVAIEKGVFLPAQHGSWKCSQKWCGYWDTCKLKP